MKRGAPLFFLFALFFILIPIAVSGYRLAVKIDGVQKRSGELKADYLAKAALAKAISILMSGDLDLKNPDLFQETLIGPYSFRFVEFKETGPTEFYVKAHIRSSFFVEKEVTARLVKKNQNEIELELLD